MKIHLAQYSTILQYIQIHVNWCFPTGKLLDGNRLSAIVILIIILIARATIATEVRPEQLFGSSNNNFPNNSFKYEEAVANFLNEHPPEPIQTNIGSIFFIKATSPVLGDLHIKLNAQPTTAESLLEGSVIRAVKMAQPMFCGPTGLIIERRLENSRIVVEIHEQSNYLGEILLPSTLCD